MTSPHDDDPPPLEEPPFDDSVVPFRGTPRTQRPGDVEDALTAAEQYVLGGMLLDKQAIDDVTAVLYDPGDFYRPAHETIFRTILDLTSSSAPVSAVTVADRLGELGDLSRVGGVTYLHTLISSTATSANAGYYAQIVAERATRRRLSAAGTRIAQLSQIESTGGVESVVEAATAELQIVLDRHHDANATSTSWDPIPTADLDLDVMTEPTLLERTDGRSLLYAGTVHAFVGESEHGKTWLALEAIRQALLAEELAAMIDFEDRAQRVVRRLIELGVPRELVNANFRYVRPDTALTVAEYPRLERAVRGCSIAVIDGVTEAMTMHGLSLGDNEDVAKFLALLPRRIANTGPCVVQIDHVVKDEEKRGRYAVGGEHKLSGLDGAQYKIIGTQPFGKGKRGTSNILIDKDREGSVRELAVGIKAAVLVLDSTPPPDRPGERGPLRLSVEPPDEGERTPEGQFRPTHIMSEISKYLDVAPDLTQNELERNLAFKAAHVRQAIRLLIAEGYVETHPGPRNSKLHRLVRPFDESGQTRAEF